MILFWSTVHNLQGTKAMQRRATSRFKSKTCQYNTCINDSQWKHISPLFSTLCIIYLKTCRLFISFQCWFNEGFFSIQIVNLSRQFYTYRSNFLVLRHEIYLWIILLSTEVGGACGILFFYHNFPLVNVVINFCFHVDSAYFTNQWDN